MKYVGGLIVNKLIGIKIVKYESFAELIKILRKYNKGSISEIKSQIQNDEYVAFCDYVDDAGIKMIKELYKELREKNVKVQLYEHGRPTDINLLYNLSNTYAEISTEVDAEMELEEADMEKLLPYEYLWTSEKSDWVVIKKDYDYSIINRTTHMFFLIEDDDLNNQLAAMMIMMGNEVFSDIKELGWS